MSAVPTTPARAATEAVALPHALTRRLALPLVFAVAATNHFLQSRGHGWTSERLRYEAWPVRPERYELKLAVPTTGIPLLLNVDVRNSPLGGRVLGVQVLDLRFRPA